MRWPLINFFQCRHQKLSSQNNLKRFMAKLPILVSADQDNLLGQTTAV